MTKWKAKDFEIKCYRTGNRLKNSAEYAYKIIWDGKEVKNGFIRKLDAINFIRKLVKIHNLQIKEIKK